MSIAVRTQRPRKKTATSPVTSTPSRPSRLIRRAEAPDRGYQNHEAPEGRLSREAPDAGEGRARLIESEFTHGRSQS